MSLLFESTFPQYTGTVDGIPVRRPVEVIRDSWGIPHIYAADTEDLMTAQGFVHAQDRLWPMELLRRMTQGRLAEVAGEVAVRSDYFVRLIGLPDIQKRAAAALSSEDRRLVQAYVGGVNAYLERQRDKLPMEFRFLGLTPQPWSVEDAFGVLSAMAWFFQSNYSSELLYVRN